MSEQSLKFYLITDLHHWAKAQGTAGKGYEEIYHREHRFLAETEAVINSVIDRLILDKETEIVLVAGDITADGAREAHDEVIPMLRRLKQAGKRVFLITATHDFHDKPLKAVGDKVGRATRTPRDDLFEMYSEFGLNEAVSVHRPSHSYSVMLDGKTRLLCMNDDGKGGGTDFCGYFDDCVEWIKQQLLQAKENGEFVMVMTHHPSLPPNPIYPILSRRDMLANYEEMTTLFADNGVKYIFTGHTHMTNIAVKTTENGNSIYDINTGALVAYPCPFRKFELTDRELIVKTLQVGDFDFDTGGKDPIEYARDHFNEFFEDVFYSLANDIDRVAELAKTFSIRKEVIYKYQKPLLKIGKVLYTRTVGEVGRFLGVRRRIDKSVRDILIKDFLIDLIDTVFHGDEPYTPDTPVHKAVSAILGRLSALSRLIPKTKKFRQTVSVITNGVLYDAPPADWDAVLPR